MNPPRSNTHGGKRFSSKSDHAAPRSDGLASWRSLLRPLTSVHPGLESLFSPSPLLAEEVERVLAEGMYETTVFFIRNQGFVRATPRLEDQFEDSLVFEQLHEHMYRDLGFQLVEVPAGPLAERVALVEQIVERLPR
jgi:predicted ATPase